MPFARQRLWAHFLCIVFTASLLSKPHFQACRLPCLFICISTHASKGRFLCLKLLRALQDLVSSIFQTWFYSVINDMPFSSLGTVFQETLKLLVKFLRDGFPSINILDCENGSAWIEDNRFYEIWGIFCWVLLITTGV